MSDIERAMRTIGRWERELNKIVPETVGDAVDLDMHRDDLEHLRDVVRAAQAPASGDVEPVGYLTVEHFRDDPNMQNIDYEHIGAVMQPGRHRVFTHPPTSGEVEPEPVAFVCETSVGKFYGDTQEEALEECKAFVADIGSEPANIRPLVYADTHAQPAQQDMYRRLADKYRQDLFACQDELNNLRSEYHNRMAELEGEIEELRSAQKGSVPEANWKASEADYDHLQNTPTPDTTPQQAVDEWIRCSDIAPVIRQLEQYDVRADEHGGKHVCKSFAYQLRQITGLKRPQSPVEQEGE